MLCDELVQCPLVLSRCTEATSRRLEGPFGPLEAPMGCLSQASPSQESHRRTLLPPCVEWAPPARAMLAVPRHPILEV